MYDEESESFARDTIGKKLYRWIFIYLPALLMFGGIVYYTFFDSLPT